MNGPTIPAPPPTVTSLPPLDECDTGKFQEDAALARVYVAACNARDEFEKWVRFLAGRLNGIEIDQAQSQAFEQRISTALRVSDERQERMESTLGDILAICKRNEANVGMLVDQSRLHAQRITTIETNPRLSLVPTGDDSDVISAQEGE